MRGSWSLITVLLFVATISKKSFGLCPRPTLSCVRPRQLSLLSNPKKPPRFTEFPPNYFHFLSVRDFGTTSLAPLLLSAQCTEFTKDSLNDTATVVPSHTKTIEESAQLQHFSEKLLNDASSEHGDSNESSVSPISDRWSSISSLVLLNFVAVLWGTQHAVIKMIVDDGHDTANAVAATFTFLRFGLAAVLASPYTPGWRQLLLSSLGTPTGASEVKQLELANGESVNSNNLVKTWRWGAEMGFWMFLGFSFQAIGLEFTTAQKSGFLLYLNVKLVPFFARVLLGRQISVATWVSALAAFAGTALLATSGNSAMPGSALHWNVGDLWSIAAAAASAMFILRLEKASAEVATDAAGLNSACLWVVTILAGLWTLESTAVPAVQDSTHSLATNFQGWGTAYRALSNDIFSVLSSHGMQLLYLSGVTTAFANWIQTKAQRDVPAERACLIYAMDPVYGAIFSNLLLDETLQGVQGWIGAALITAAAATNAVIDLPSRKQLDESNK